MFSDKFIRLPIRVYDKGMMDMVGVTQEIPTYEMVNPFHISSYRPSQEPEGCTYISFKDGTGMMVYMEIKEFEDYMDSHNLFK
jgi:hypothetical protein